MTNIVTVNGMAAVFASGHLTYGLRAGRAEFRAEASRFAGLVESALGPRGGL